MSDSKTTGTVEIPTSIDRAETTIIAAAIETIDRVGPCDAKFEIKGIEDVRTSKREYIVERAKKLIEKFQGSAPELRTIQQDIVNHSRTSKVREFGKELLAAGPDVETSSEIIVVEGRADVITLLRAGIKNAIAMNGTVVPNTIKELSKEKQVTLFLDGDRGGLLIAKDVLANAQVAFIARAPDGKEVEELTEKEIITCLRNRMSVEDFSAKYLKRARQASESRERREDKEERSYRTRERGRNYRESRGTRGRESREFREREPREPLTKIEVSDDTIEKNMGNLQGWLYEIDGTKSALLIGLKDGGFEILRKTSLNEVPRFLLRTQDAIGLVIDGNATLNIIKAAEKSNCKFIVAKNFTTTSYSLKLISF